MLTSRTRVALLTLVIAASLLWLALRSSDRREPASTSRNVVETIPSEEGSRDIVPTPVIDTVPFRETVLTDVRVVDKLSREAIPNATLFRQDSGGQPVTLGVSDAKGILKLDERELGGTLLTTVTVGTHEDFGVLQLTARVSGGESVQAKGVVVEVDLNAGIEVKYPAFPPNEPQQIRLRTYSLPPLPRDCVKKPTELEGLDFARSHSPDAYVVSMKEMGLVKDLHEAKVMIHNAEYSQRIMVPYSGDVIVESIALGYMVDKQLAVSKRGDITSVSAVLRRKPHITGRIVPTGGVDVSNVEVKISCRARLMESDYVPHSTNEPGSPAVSIWRKRGESGAHVLIDHVASTNSEGRFLVEVPFTGQVSCYVVIPGFDLGRVHTSAAGNYDPVTDIEIIPKALGVALRTMRLVNELGEPLGNQFLTYYDADDFFMMRFPRVKTDERGWFDISLLNESKSYTFAHRGIRTQCTARDGGVVRVLPTTK